MFENIQSENFKLSGLVEEKDKILEEMAEQLFDAKVQMDTLRENDSSVVADRSPGGQWLEDSDVRSCQICDKEFNISRRKVSFIFWRRLSLTRLRAMCICF